MASCRVRLAAGVVLSLLGAGCAAQSAPTPVPVDTPPNPPNSAIPSPDAPTPPPPDGVQVTTLPTAGDMAGRVPGAWRETATGPRSPDHPVSGCQRSQWESFGATSLQVREYAGPGATSAAAVTMGFATAQDAERALVTVNEWWGTCSDVVRSRGGSGVDVVDPPSPVPVEGGQGSVSQRRWTMAGATVVEAHGTILHDRRLGVVVITDTAPTPRESLVTTVENAARRLRG